MPAHFTAPGKNNQAILSAPGKNVLTIFSACGKISPIDRAEIFDRRRKTMTIDERIQRQLERQGVDLQSDEGAALFQQTLDAELDRQRGAVKPQARKVQKVRGIMV
jgi:hypothetical protein